MSNKSKAAQRAIANVNRRPSAGNAIQVVGDPVGVGLGRSIKIDMGKLPTPSNVYDADYAWIEHRPGSASLFFAKRNRDAEETLLTRLELRYPVENLVGHFWHNSREFHQKVKDFVGLWPVDDARRGIDPSSMKALKQHSEWANFESMAHAGTEAVVDFFSLPPVGIARFARGQGSKGLILMPVVRVQTSIFELMRLLDATAAVVKDIETYLPARLSDEPDAQRDHI
jgi:hypothetical protein